MSAATASAIREEIDGQWSGYWLDDGHQSPQTEPSYRPTGAILRRIGETSGNDFVCLDLVLVETPDGFVWLPLSEAGRYTYAHSLGLLQNQNQNQNQKQNDGWRLAVWVDGVKSEYDAAYAESLSPAELASLYGSTAHERARPDRPTVQLRLRLRPT